MHELKEISSFPWVCWRDLHAQLPCCLLGAGSTPVHHRLTWSGCLKGLGLSGVVPTSAVRISVDLSQITQEKYIEGADAIFWLPQRWEPVQKPEHSFLLKKKKKLLSIVSVVLDALSAQSKRTKQVNAFSSQESCICINMKFVSRRFS